MSDFAIVAEGYTDQLVIDHLVAGCTQSSEFEPDVTFLQPPNDETSAHGSHPSGGWTLVIEYFRSGRHRQALQLNHYLIVQIDTDRCEEFGVVRTHDGRGRTSAELIDATIAMFQSLIGPDGVAKFGDRILFAVSVDSLECWLLPLVYDVSERAKRSKITGCLDAMNNRLAQQDEKPLSVDGKKDPNAYRKITRAFAKWKTINTHRDANASLDHFVTQLERVLPTLSSGL